ncbi:hypothetical protein K2X40_00190 [Candidatus Babeliales bacterium]|nr:hypothetical protein [Candidatus Babeliales bacterium]
MFHKLIRTFWGDLKGQELTKFLLLALGFFFLIGSYWPLKTLKDSIFVNIVGPEYIPMAKILSLTIFFPLVMIYSKLVDIFVKEKMVYLLVSVYGFIGLIFVYFFFHPTIGLQNSIPSASRLLGWLFFLYVESYVSLMISLFWSFTHDITTPESAKKGYGLIIFGTQLGGFLLTLLGNRLSADPELYASRAPIIALISICLFFFIALVTFILHKIVAKEILEGYEDKVAPATLEEPTSVGFLDGLKLLLTHPYVAGIFFLIFFHEFVSTVMNFQMIMQAKTTYVSAGLVNKFLFDYALAVQGTACLFGLLGTSFFQRRFGIRFCLIAYPLLLGISIVYYLANPTLQSIFYVMIIAKAINYAFNQPAKEVLYIPTTKNIKYKSKAWIDMFGMRFSKAAGSTANTIIVTMSYLTGPIVLSLIAIWAILASMIGKTFNTAISEKKIID